MFDRCRQYEMHLLFAVLRTVGDLNGHRQPEKNVWFCVVLHGADMEEKPWAET